MYFLRRFLFRSIFRRLSRGNRSQYETGRRSSGGRFGFFGPMPYYSKQTRGGSRVSVGGCCLPLALGMVATPGVAASVAVRRRRRR